MINSSLNIGANISDIYSKSYNLVPNLTVRENIEVGAYLSDKPLPIDELIELLGLDGS